MHYTLRRIGNDFDRTGREGRNAASTVACLPLGPIKLCRMPRK
jgi:hypothetical protein